MSEHAYSSRSLTVPFHGPFRYAPLFFAIVALITSRPRLRAYPQRDVLGPYRLALARINTPPKVGYPKHLFIPPYRPGVCQPLRQTLRPGKPRTTVRVRQRAGVSGGPRESPT